MSDFVGIITTSAAGDGVSQARLSAEKVLLLNDSGKLGGTPQVRFEQGKAKGMIAESLFAFPAMPRYRVAFTK